MTNHIANIQEGEYREILRQTVALIDCARSHVARHIATTVSNMYWEIGRLLHEKKIEKKYGNAVVRKLSADLKDRYPKMGLSPRQLWNMSTFYNRYERSSEKVLRSVAFLSWSHNLLILSKKLDDTATFYYAQQSPAKR